MSMPVTVWRAWKCVWGRTRSHWRACGSRLKGGQGEGLGAWVCAAGHASRRTVWVTPCLGRREQAHGHEAPSSWGISMPLVSVGGRTGQDTGNRGGSWTV